MRRCRVKDVKTQRTYRAKFHQWVQESWVIEPSPMVGGHPGGQMSTVYALVEFEDGTCDLVRPTLIKFLEEESDEQHTDCESISAERKGTSVG